MKKIFCLGFALILFVFSVGLFVVPASAFSYSEGDSSYSLIPYVDYSISYIGKSYIDSVDGESIRYPQMSLGPISVFDTEYNSIRYSSFEEVQGALPDSLEGFRQVVDVEQMEGVLFNDTDAFEYGLTFYDVSSFDDFTQLHTTAGEDIEIIGFDFSMNDFVIDLSTVMTGEELGHGFNMFFLPTFIYNSVNVTNSSIDKNLSFDLVVFEVKQDFSSSSVQSSTVVPVLYHCTVVLSPIVNNIIAFNNINVYAYNENGYAVDLYDKYHSSTTYAQVTNFNFSFRYNLNSNGDISHFNDITYNVNYCDKFTYNTLISPFFDDGSGNIIINSIPSAPEGQLRYTPNLVLPLYDEISALNYSWYWEANKWYGRWRDLAGGDVGDIAASFVGSIADTVSRFFDIDVFGVGLTLGHIVGVVLTILIVIVFLKLFAGG